LNWHGELRTHAATRAVGNFSLHIIPGVPCKIPPPFIPF